MNVVEILDDCKGPPPPPNNFAEARKLMAQELADDENLRLGYQALIAVLLHDRFQRADFRDPAVRNAAANAILHLVFYS